MSTRAPVVSVRSLSPKSRPRCGAHAQRAEVARRDQRGFDLDGLATPREVHAQIGGRHRGQRVKHLGAISKGLELAVRELDDGGALLEVGFPDHHQPVGLGKRQRRQQHGLHGRVDRGGGADGETNRRDGRKRERRADAKASNGLTERC